MSDEQGWGSPPPGTRDGREAPVLPVLGYAAPVAEVEVPEPVGHWTNFVLAAWFVGFAVSGARAAHQTAYGIVADGFGKLVVPPILAGLIGLGTNAASTAAVRRLARPLRPRLRGTRVGGVVGAAHAALVFAAAFTVGQKPADQSSDVDRAMLVASLVVVPLLAPLALLRATAVKG
ncbi:MAG TPA: hypothetical protein VF796_21070 [Humisphaera sp.]